MFVLKFKCEALPQLKLLPREEIIIGEEANASLRSSSIIPPSLNSVCKAVSRRANAALEVWVFPAPFLFSILWFWSVFQGRALRTISGGVVGDVSPAVLGGQVCAGFCTVWGTGGHWAPAEVCKSCLCCFLALPQVLLPAGHASSGVWWLCEAGDWIQHLQGGGASPQLLHHSLKAGVDNHGDGEILLQSGVHT